MNKVFVDENVYDAANRRLALVFRHFHKIYVSFSGGKDSSLLLHLALAKARERGRLPLDVLFIDLEGQYAHTIEHVREMMSLPGIRGHWVCLPLNLRNAVSQIEPYWRCWDPEKKDSWVRKLPDHPAVISDPAHFPFFRPGMEFEEFVVDFAAWFSGGDDDTACLVAIRADESLNRFRTIRNRAKDTFEGHQWTTKISRHVYNAYPLYDWRAQDIWAANGKFGFSYNRIYDLMYLAGVPLRAMRICQPYGDDQRKGLYLFKLLEPETWARIVARVEGANLGNRYAGDRALGNRKIVLPPGHTYKSYAKFLLDTMPPHHARHYRKKIFKFLNWWRKHARETGYASIPDCADPKLEAKRAAPSWRRICKVLLRNDYWCTALSFSPTRREHERQLEASLKAAILPNQKESPHDP
jgi:predicted phosphoadenosine phosphosulfate sulfurtransferase